MVERNLTRERGKVASDNREAAGLSMHPNGNAIAARYRLRMKACAGVGLIDVGWAYANSCHRRVYPRVIPPWESLSNQARLVSSLKYVYYMCSLMSARQILV